MYVSALFIFHSQFSLTTVALLILVITSRVHPYTNKWANFAEGLILLDLVFISAYFLNYNRLSNASNDKFVIMLLILPFIYFFLYLMIKILRYVSYIMNEKAYSYKTCIQPQQKMPIYPVKTRVS